MDTQTSTSGPPSGFDAAVAAINYMRERDCDFLTVANVQDYSGANEAQARAALIHVMGYGWMAKSDEADQASSWMVTIQTPGTQDVRAIEFRAATREGASSEARRVFGSAKVLDVQRKMPAAPLEGWDVIDGQRTVQTPDGRLFAVVTGRRWTRVHEYLTNGQLTARFFVDEATGEAREADGWRKPKRWPMPAGASDFARWIVELANDPTGGV